MSIEKQGNSQNWKLLYLFVQRNTSYMQFPSCNNARLQVLPFLLRHALDLRHPESEVLIEDGLQLLQIVLKRSDQMLPEYKVRNFD